MRRTALLALILCGTCFNLALADETFGWRRDGSGVFHNVQPPSAWENRDDVRWKVTLPDWSNSSPAVVGNLIFVCAEPTRLIAINRTDGEIVWQVENGYDLVLSDEQMAKVKADTARADELRKELDDLRKQIDGLHKLRKDADEAGKKVFDAQIEPLDKQTHQLDEQIKPLERYRLTGRSAGYSTATPVGDGEHVYVVFGTGVAVAYDLRGNRRWIKLVDDSQLDWGHTASPILVDGLLIVHIQDMVALDVKTGDERWRTKVEPAYGSPLIAKIANQNVIVTAKGSVVAAANGKLWGDKLVKGLSRNCPVMQDGVVFYIEEHAQALKLPDTLSEPLKSEIVWESKLNNDNYFSSPVVYDGRIYAVSEKRTLTVLDAASGNVLSEQKLRFKKSRGPVLSSLAVAEGKLFVMNEEGAALVLSAIREPEQLNESPLDSLRSSPVFDGGEIFIRCNQHLYSIGK